MSLENLIFRVLLVGPPLPSTFTLFSQKLISTIQSAIVSTLKFLILSPAWFNLPLPDPSPCRLSWSSSVFFFFLPCRLIFRWPHRDVRRWHRCQSNHLKGTRSCQWWGSRALLRRRRQAKQLLLVEWLRNWRALLPRGNQQTQVL